MTEPQNDPLRRAVAFVSAGNPPSLKTGTAFLVAEQYVLTALHVVADRSKSIEGKPKFFTPITLNFIDAGQKIEAKPVEDCWNVNQDWVLLKLDFCLVDVVPLLLSELKGGKKPEWDTFGYAAINKTDGIKASGNVEYESAKFEGGVHVYQLQCTQAGASRGEKLEGLSGAPCIVNNVVVGILRSSQVKVETDEHDNRTLVQVGGIIYACPISSIQAKDLPPIIPLPSNNINWFFNIFTLFNILFLFGFFFNG